MDVIKLETEHKLNLHTASSFFLEYAFTRKLINRILAAS